MSTMYKLLRDLDATEQAADAQYNREQAAKKAEQAKTEAGAKQAQHTPKPGMNKVALTEELAKELLQQLNNTTVAEPV